jgi:alpha-beta hydrolase superfamily lysophospholipase
MANRPKSHVNKEWLFALVAIVLIIGIAVPFAIGWVLAAPVQISVGKAPSDLDAEAVEFKSNSGAIVKGWWCPTVNSRGVVLLLPGIRANRLSMVDRARFLRRAGYSVLLIDFQATGETKGDHITFGWKESRDALAAVDFIHHVDPSARVAIIGSSLGGVAALLATPPLKVNALILESVYPTIEIATRNRMENYLGPIGRMFAPLFLMQLHRRIGVSPSQLHPIDHIAAVDCPILIMSGEKDRNTRPVDTQILFQRARSPGQLWFVPNAGHVDLHQSARAEYESRVLAFLANPPESK